MNKLLERQIKKVFGEINTMPNELLPLLNTISETYDGFETDRVLMEHSFDLSTEELLEINKRLENEIAEKAEIEKELEKKVNELSVFYKASFGREERILELKKEVRELQEKLEEI